MGKHIWKDAQLWVADFEDAPENDIPFDRRNRLNGFVARVWLWCAVGVYNGQRVTGFSIESFIQWLDDGTRKLVYFHNLKHDGSFILDYVYRFKEWQGVPFRHVEEDPIKAGEFTTFIDDRQAHYFYRFKWAKRGFTEIRDSLKIAPESVKSLGQSIGLYKGCLDDYQAIRPVGYVPTKDEIDYCYRDCEIVAVYVRKFWSNGLMRLNRLTAGSDSLALLRYLCYQKDLGWKKGSKAFSRDFPPLTEAETETVAKAYQGGLCFVNPDYRGALVPDVVSLDINSMYPAQMRQCLLPCGKPHAFLGVPPKDKPLWIATLALDYKVKPGRFPTIHKSFGMQRFSSFSTEARYATMTVTNVDWELIQSQYDVDNVEWQGGYWFKGKVGALGAFVDYLYAQKAVLKSSDAMRFIVKRMLNSAYGKFGQKTKAYRDIPRMENGLLVYEEEKLKEVKPSKAYMPFACFVTAYARKFIMDNIEKVHQYFCYCDTDSMKLAVPNGYKGKALEDWLESLGVPLDAHALGAFKNETGLTPIPFAKFLRPKTYACFDGNKGTVSVTVAGLRNREAVTIDNFQDGTTYKGGRLQPFQCVGGVTLQPVDFSIIPG